MSDIKNGFYLKIDDSKLEALNQELNLTKRELISVGKKAFNFAVNTFVSTIKKRLRRETSIDRDVIETRTRKYMYKKDIKAKVFNGLNRINISRWNCKITKRGLSYGVRGNKILNRKSWMHTSPRGGRKAYERKEGAKIRAKYGVNKGKLIEPYGEAMAEIDNVITPILEEELNNFPTIYEQKFFREYEKFVKKQIKKMLKAS